MNRFLKVFSLLILSLFLVVSGVNTGLDQLSRTTGKSSFTQYDEKGSVVYSYSGDLSQYRPYIKRATVSEFHYIRRS